MSTPASRGYILHCMKQPLTKQSFSFRSPGGSISLRSSNPLDAPIIDPNFLSHPFDIVAMREGIRAAQRFVASPAFSENGVTGLLPPWNGAVSDSEIEEVIRDIAVTAWHPIGTAAMSPENADWGVVDPDLRVKGVDGLRIIDASIMVCVSVVELQVLFLIKRRGTKSRIFLARIHKLRFTSSRKEHLT